MAQGVYLTNKVGFGPGQYNDVPMEQLANQGMWALRLCGQHPRRCYASSWRTFRHAASHRQGRQGGGADFNPEVVARYRLLAENRAIADDEFRDDMGGRFYEIASRATATACTRSSATRTPKASSPPSTWCAQAGPAVLRGAGGTCTLTKAQLTPAFTETSPSFQLAVIVAEYAGGAARELLGAGKHAGGRPGGGGADWPASFEDNADVEEFVELTQAGAGCPRRRRRAV